MTHLLDSLKAMLTQLQHYLHTWLADYFRRGRRAHHKADGKENLVQATSAAASTSALHQFAARRPHRVANKGSSSSDSAGGKLSQSRSAELNLICDGIGDADLQLLVSLPPGLELNEWIATHTVAFFHHINLLWGAVSLQYCTADYCPVMCGPANQQWSWVDERGKKMRCAAPQYIELSMSFIQQSLHSQDFFPTKFGQQFAANFECQMKKMLRCLSYVLLHLLCHHLHQLRWLGLESQALACASHLSAFVETFSLLETAKDLQLLRETVTRLRGDYAAWRLAADGGLPHLQEIQSEQSCVVLARVDLADDCCKSPPSAMAVDNDDASAICIDAQTGLAESGSAS